MKQTENSLNLIRAFSHHKWGADPNILCLFYKAFLRSILGYGCLFYGSAAETHLKKLEQIKNKALRKCIGLLNSTPINILEAETLEPPLSLRRNFLTDKFLLRLIAKDNRMVDKIHTLTVLGYTHTYWRVKKLPLLVLSYSWLTQFKDKIYQSSLAPYYQLNPSNINIRPTIIIKCQDNIDENIIRTNFLKDLGTLWQGHEHIFTDGSLIDKKSGCAFYHKNKNIWKQFRLPNEASIYTAELWAILEALKFCLDFEQNNRFVIFSDSKSALEGIKNSVNIALNNHIILEILKLCHNLKTKNIHISLVWIKAHAGITGNEIVDKLAKEATKIVNINCNLKIPFTDLVRKAKEKMFYDWQEQYNNCNKGLFYKEIFPLIPRTRWYNAISNRSFIRLISRIRTSHALYPKHKKRIGISVNELCNCGEIGDLEHVILKCNNIGNNLTVLMDNLGGFVPQPFNLNYLIALNNLNIYNLLYKYIITSKIEL